MKTTRRVTAAAVGAVLMSAGVVFVVHGGPAPAGAGAPPSRYLPAALTASGVPGPYGETFTGAYEGAAEERLAATPYDGVGLPQVTFESLTAGPPGPLELPKLSRLVAVAKVESIGDPRWNSHDGSFWDPALHDESGVTDVANELYREVTVRLDEVWGAEDFPAAARGATVAFSMRGGQAVVRLSDSTADELGYGEGGDYVYSSSAPADLTVGDRVVLFLNHRPIDGLYRGRYGHRFQAAPAQETMPYLVFKADGEMVGYPQTDQLDVSVSALKTVIAQDLGAAAGPGRQPGTVPARKHEVAGGGTRPTETDAPAHDHGVEHSHP